MMNGYPVPKNTLIISGADPDWICTGISAAFGGCKKPTGLGQ